ncbi:MAG: Signal recognition particle protein [Legionellaceae bacterium]
MFENLTTRLAKTIKHLTGQGRLTEDNIKDTLREIRTALFEADVALPVIKTFIEKIKTKAIGENVLLSLSPGQVLIKIVNDELTEILGETNAEINLKTQPPAVILLAGLQGSGKTTTAGKLAYWLKNKQKKSVLVASTDIYRPAAIDQLETLAKEINIEFFPSNPSQHPLDIAMQAIETAKVKNIDTVIIDTAGRMHLDTKMMQEISDIHQKINPIETLLVVDSMTGQDAANIANIFNSTLALTGIILTKTDGDARGGAALSIRTITGKPIKFIGVGEKITALEPFYPDRMASRILGMGDILSLVEDAHEKLDKTTNLKLANKLKKGKSFDLEDFKQQIQQMNNMGGMAELISKLPGTAGLPPAIKEQMENNKMMKQIEAIINSMTRQERRYPDIIRGSRKRRIALGSGTQVPDVNRLLKQFTQMQKMMKRFSKQGGLMKMMQGFAGKGLPF